MTGLSVVRGGDTFWADVRAKTRTLQSDLEQLEAEADDLLLDLTRSQMAGER